MGDIVLTTDNEYFIKGAHKDHNIITYEKGLAVPAKMTVANITKTVSKGFGTGVGGFSNVATILYAMAPMFDKPGREEQHAEIMMRIKLLREIVGQEIDRNPAHKGDQHQPKGGPFGRQAEHHCRKQGQHAPGTRLEQMADQHLYQQEQEEKKRGVPVHRSNCSTSSRQARSAIIT